MLWLTKRNVACLFMIALAVSGAERNQNVPQKSVQTNNTSISRTDSRKIVEFGNVGWDDEMSRLDYLDNILLKEPETIAYIFVYGGRFGDRRGETQARMACIENYMVKRRGVSANRIRLSNAGYRQKSTVEIWVSSIKATPPKPTPTVHARSVKFKRAKIRDWRQRCNN